MSEKNAKKPGDEVTAEASAVTSNVDATAPAGGDTEDKKKVDPKELKASKKEKKSQAQEKAGTAPAAGKGKGQGKGKADKKGEAGAFVKRSKPPRLREKYYKETVPALIKEFGYKTTMAVPRLVKITLNMGLGQALLNAKLVEASVTELQAIAGQKPVVTKARKSIATFKLRQGQKIGCMVTLRQERMYEFLDRFVTFALPRTRDFKGISSRSFDGRGNYTLGIREQIIFPEIEYDKIEKIMGMNISIITTAKTDDEGRALLRHLGMPFR